MCGRSYGVTALLMLLEPIYLTAAGVRTVLQRIARLHTIRTEENE